jgi:hypothetical protein
MMEFILAFFLTVAAVDITTHAATTAYNYAEPKVTQGVAYVKEVLSPEEVEE